MNKDWVPYLAGVASILFGVVLLWAPPPLLASDAGAVGIALSFITGGFAALGVTVGVRKLMKAAREQGFAQGQLLALAPEGGPHDHPPYGHGHIHLTTKNKGNIVEVAADAVRAWSLVPGNLDASKFETFDSVNAMEDPFDPSTGKDRPKGSLVIVQALLPKTGRHSLEAHERMGEITTALANDPTCKQYWQPNQVVHWCCWSDH